MDPSEETEEWAVWYDESHSQTLNMEQFDELALEVGRVESYDDMRRMWNSMVHINGKPQTWSNTRVFRSSVLPHDQDPENANGGQAILRLSLKDWNVCFWLNLLAVVFDGQLSFVEHVTGMVLSCRPTGFLISLWHDNQLTADQIDTLSSELRLLFDCQDVTHRAHREAAARRHSEAREQRMKRKANLDPRRSGCSKKGVDVDSALGALEKKYNRSKQDPPGSLRCDLLNVLGMVGITLLVTLVRWMSSLAEYLLPATSFSSNVTVAAAAPIPAMGVGMLSSLVNSAS